MYFWTPVEIWQDPEIMQISGKGAWNGTLLAVCGKGFWSCQVVYHYGGFDYTHTNRIPAIGMIPDLFYVYTKGWIRYNTYDRCKYAGRYRVSSLVSREDCPDVDRVIWTLFGLKNESTLL